MMKNLPPDHTRPFITPLAGILLGLAVSPPALACTTCNQPLQEAIFGHDFAGIFLKMLLPFLLLGLVIRFLYRLK
jgi:hypothetical protein